MQTEFDVKLVKFGEKDKIKVIKEVRNILPDLKLAEVSVGSRWLTRPIKVGGGSPLMDGCVAVLAGQEARGRVTADAQEGCQ